MHNKIKKRFEEFQAGDVCEYSYKNKLIYRFIILKKIVEKSGDQKFKIFEIRPKKGRIINFFFNEFNYINYRKVL